MNVICDNTDYLMDGELSPRDADAARYHMRFCHSCQERAQSLVQEEMLLPFREGCARATTEPELQPATSRHTFVSFLACQCALEENYNVIMATLTVASAFDIERAALGVFASCARFLLIMVDLSSSESPDHAKLAHAHLLLCRRVLVRFVLDGGIETARQRLSQNAVTSVDQHLREGIHLLDIALSSWPSALSVSRGAYSVDAPLGSPGGGAADCTKGD